VPADEFVARVRLGDVEALPAAVTQVLG